MRNRFLILLGLAGMLTLGACKKETCVECKAYDPDTGALTETEEYCSEDEENVDLWEAAFRADWEVGVGDDVTCEDK